MKNNPYYLYIALMFGMLIGVGSILIDDHINSKKEKEQIKTCECLNYYQWQYFSTKRDRIINKMYGAKKSKREPLQDSLKKINIILGIEETLDNPPNR